MSTLKFVNKLNKKLESHRPLQLLYPTITFGVVLSPNYKTANFEVTSFEMQGRFSRQRRGTIMLAE